MNGEGDPHPVVNLRNATTQPRLQLSSCQIRFVAVVLFRARQTYLMGFDSLLVSLILFCLKQFTLNIIYMHNKINDLFVDQIQNTMVQVF